MVVWWATDFVLFERMSGELRAGACSDSVGHGVVSTGIVNWDYVPIVVQNTPS